jgi:hypothetical protein
MHRIPWLHNCVPSVLQSVATLGTECHTKEKGRLETSEISVTSFKYTILLLDLLLAIRICAENFPNEFESREKEFPHEIPATTNHSHNEGNREQN